jgi:hypothetical protein
MLALRGAVAMLFGILAGVITLVEPIAHAEVILPNSNPPVPETR